MRGFKIAHGKLGKKLRAARDRLSKLIAKRRNLPSRVEIRDLSERTVVKLATERKHLTDLTKMLAYQAESDLLNLLRPHYPRADQEGRTLLHELFAAAGDVNVTEDELHITLAPLSSRIELALRRPCASFSIRPLQRSQALGCAFASPCAHHRASALLSLARQPTAALWPTLSQPPEHPETGHFLRRLCQEV